MAAFPLVGALISLFSFAAPSSAQVLIDSPFVTGFEGWESTEVDPPQVGQPASWGVLLTPDPFSGQRFLMESSDGRHADGPMPDDGLYDTFKLINTVDVTPAAYTLDYQLATVDNDGFGIVFGYQDEDNYFRVGFREQASNLGFPNGTSVQKVVDGVTTQLGVSANFIPDTLGTQFAAKVIVDGPNWDVQVNNVSILNGSDTALQPGNYGVHSWGQRLVDSDRPDYGTLVGPISVTSTSLNKTTDFTDALSDVPFRRLVMVNQFGETGFETGTGVNVAEDHGNFQQDFLNGTIRDDSNGNIESTPGAPNIDFMGPAVVVNELGSESMTDYRYAVRVENRDNDGIGLLFRVASDSSFYRINWATEGPGEGTTRPPLGMSIQKYNNFSWTQIYADDPNDPVFLPQDSVPFDVSIQAVGNEFKIDVINDPEGSPELISYGTIQDNSFDPILQGSVGFTNWGNGSTNNGAVYSAYNGDYDSLVSALTTFVDFGLVIDRDNGNATFVNNAAGSSGVKGISIQSAGGALIPLEWSSVADNYDEAPQDGSVDNDDPWTELVATEFELSEREDSGGNGGQVTNGVPVDLGDVWTASQVEDLVLIVELLDGNTVVNPVSYVDGPGGMAWHRSDLNTDGSVNAVDWGLMYPNLLADVSGMSLVEQALAGNVDLTGGIDVDDFAIFKADYDLFNGVGSFDAMVANVPEPSTVALLFVAFVAVCGSRLRRYGKSFAMAIGVVVIAAIGSSARAVPLDFTTFGTANYPHADSDNDNTDDFFPITVWEVTANTATHNSNSDYSVLYSPDSAFNKKFTGTLTPGSDDDVAGFVLGFEPGDEQIGSSADYLIIDWKGSTQNFDVFDFAGAHATFHDLTPTGFMPSGLALSRVTGSPNGDELWQHVDYPENPDGSIVELARGSTLGSSAWVDDQAYQFEIQYTPNLVTVKVDGVEQFSAAGEFPDGRFGLYQFAQNPVSTWSDFDVSDADPIGLNAVVDLSDGTIKIVNPFGGQVDFDFYRISSESDSLDADAWNSLHEQNFQSVGPGDHQQWQEAGGSDSGVIGEAFLAGNSFLTGGNEVEIGAAFDHLGGMQDLVFQYRMANGIVRHGFVEYIGVAPGLNGDYNNDGMVNAADYVFWRDQDSNNAAAYTTWKNNFGGGSGSGGVQAAVPEPTGLALVACGLVALLVGPRLGRKRAA